MKARTVFRVGCWTLLATAAIHAIPHFSGLPEPENASEEQLFGLLTSYRRDVGGLERSTYDFIQGYSWYFMLLLGLVGTTGLAVTTRTRSGSPLLRTVAGLNVVFLASLTVITGVYMILPPMILLGFATVCFALAFHLGRRQPPVPAVENEAGGRGA